MVRRGLVRPGGVRYGRVKLSKGSKTMNKLDKPRWIVTYSIASLAGGSCIILTAIQHYWWVVGVSVVGNLSACFIERYRSKRRNNEDMALV
jgi:hypothetical protein